VVDFDAEQLAFYSIRVQEITTPRWTTYDAPFFGVDLPEGAGSNFPGASPGTGGNAAHPAFGDRLRNAVSPRLRLSKPDRRVTPSRPAPSPADARQSGESQTEQQRSAGLGDWIGVVEGAAHLGRDVVDSGSYVVAAMQGARRGQGSDQPLG
jgi:hypothetical protein